MVKPLFRSHLAAPVAVAVLTLGACSSDAPVDGDPAGGAGSAAAGMPAGTAGAPPSGGGPGSGGSAGSSAGAGSSSGGQGGTSAGAGGANLAGGGAGGSAGGSGTAGSGGGGGSGGAGGAKSAGCGKQRTLQNGSISLGGRKYTLRVPDDYDNERPYRLILGFHGATGNSGQVAPSFFGLWSLAAGSTIFLAPDAVGGIWSSATDVDFVDDILEQIQADLCIDTSRIQLEGFSQGGAMAWTLACARPGIFRAAVVHSGGGLARPTSCPPIAFMSSLGQDESSGAGQTSNSDFFAKQNGCTVTSLPKAPSGGHACSDYQGCSAGHPTRWCDYDGGHTPAPNDAGQNMSWMPQEVWKFLSEF